MITKAYIVELPEQDSNIFKVSIPFMEDNTSSDAIFDALLCNSPIEFNGLKVGDCVFVGFEDDKLNTAIILGKLYTDVPNYSSVYGLMNELNVTQKATLPLDTKIGNFTAQDLFNLYQGVANGTGGTINPDDLKEFVRWIVTDRIVEEEEVEIFADKIRVMTGEEWDDYKESEDFDEDEFNETLYFLSSLPKSDETDDSNNSNNGNSSGDGGNG